MMCMNPDIATSAEMTQGFPEMVVEHSWNESEIHQNEPQLNHTTIYHLNPTSPPPFTPWSKYMAQSQRGRSIHGLYKPIHGNCAIYFYPGVTPPPPPN